MRPHNFRTPLLLTQPTRPTVHTHGEVAAGSDKWELSDKIGSCTIKLLGLWKGRGCLDWWYAKWSSQAVSSVPQSCYYSTTTTHQLQPMFSPLIHASPNGEPPGCNMRPAATFENHVYSTITQAVSGCTAYCYFALCGPSTSRQPRLWPFAMKRLEVRVLALSVLGIKTEQYSYQGYSFLWYVTLCSLIYGTVVSGEFTASIFIVGEQRWQEHFSQNLRCPSSKSYDTSPRRS